MHLDKLVHSKTGKVVLSILLGFGLASLFKRVCKGKDCHVFKAPPLEEIVEKSYRYNNKCYKYNSVATKCDNSKQISHF